jgi:hypothetical protein
MPRYLTHRHDRPDTLITDIKPIYHITGTIIQIPYAQTGHIDPYALASSFRYFTQIHYHLDTLRTDRTPRSLCTGIIIQIPYAKTLPPRYLTHRQDT